MNFTAKEAREITDKHLKEIKQPIEKDFSYVYKLIKMKAEEVDSLDFPIVSNDNVLVMGLELFSDKLYAKIDLMNDLMVNEFLIAETTDGFLHIQW